MSVLAVKKEKDKIIIASDSQETSGEMLKECRLGNKLHSINGITLGYSGNSHYATLFRSFLNANRISGKSELHIINYFSAFNGWVAKTLGHQLDKFDQQGTCQFLIIVGNKVWMYSDYFIKEVGEGEYAAIGSGSEAALACLSAGLSVEEAVRAACQVNLYCSEPIKVLEVKI